MKSACLSGIVNRVGLGFLKYGWWTSTYHSDSNPIIIGGCERSGTTLLRSLLNAHSKIFIGRDSAILQGNSNLDHLSGTTGLPLDRIKAHYRASACLGQFLENISIELMRQNGKTRWGEKTPWNVRDIGRHFQFFPNARFVHIIRDGRDVVCSLRTFPKYRSRDGKRVPTGILNPWSRCISQWVADLQAGLTWRSDPRYTEIKYEDLVTQPEAIMRSLFAWLGECWEPDILTSFMTDEFDAHPNLVDPVNSKPVGRWQRDLPSEARRAFTGIACTLLVQLGYTNDRSWVGVPASAAYATTPFGLS
jgi:hypothetical protein